LGIGLTLAIHKSADVLEERRQVHFGPLAPPRGKRIETAEATGEFMHAFANREAIPAQFAFSPALAAGPEFFDRARHKESARAAFKHFGRVDKQHLE
jgi:hypothetical protein